MLLLEASLDASQSFVEVKKETHVTFLYNFYLLSCKYWAWIQIQQEAWIQNKIGNTAYTIMEFRLGEDGVINASGGVNLDSKGMSALLCFSATRHTNKPALGSFQHQHRSVEMLYTPYCRTLQNERKNPRNSQVKIPQLLQGLWGSIFSTDCYSTNSMQLFQLARGQANRSRCSSSFQFFLRSYTSRQDVVIVGAARTPFGSFRGSLSSIGETADFLQWQYHRREHLIFAFTPSLGFIFDSWVSSLRHLMKNLQCPVP